MGVLGRFPLALVVLAPRTVAQDEDPAALLARAEALVCDDHAKEARRIYEELAEEHASTTEGKVAAVRIAPSAFLGACDLLIHGPSENRVDVVVMGDGYELKHLRAFDELAEDAITILGREEPFREYWSYFNFRRAVCVSAEAGVDGYGRDYDTALGGYTLGTVDGHVAIDARLVRGVLGEIPTSDGLAIVFVKLGILGTGGDGIGVIGGRNARTIVHEWGHAFARLGDEYADFTHERGGVSTAPNVSPREDPAEVPWKHWIEARHPSIGVYEGAAGQVRDAFRPVASGCFMNKGEEFCPVCREALLLRVYALVDPIDGVSPQPPPIGIREPILLWDKPVEIRVTAMRPESHDLEASWWVEPAGRYPVTGGDPAPVARAAVGTRNDRTLRGPLAPMEARPTKTEIAGKDAEFVLRLSRVEMEPGEYRITCRVRDTTRLRGERWPWVLKDDRDLLVSERIWWLEVR